MLYLDSCHGLQDIHFFLLDALLHGQALVDIHIGDGAFMGADNAASCAGTQKLHCLVAHLRGVYPIPR